MKFKYYECKKLPKLSWCAIYVKNSKDINVYHGCGVETKEDFFVEGAWDGDFLSAKFEESNFFMGSGAKLINKGVEGVCFSTSNHTLERIYTISEDIYIYI